MAFDFVVETANMAKSNPKKFINEWIMNEITEMISGLKNMAKHPDEEIKKLIRQNGKKVANGFCYSVKNMRDDDIKDYEVYTNEMNIAIKAEKITGALLFLEKLSEMAELFSTIYKSIDEIKRLNNALIPELEESILKIQNELDKEHKELEEPEHELEILNEQIKPYEDAIHKLKEEYKSWKERDEVVNNYKYEHPEYCKLCSEKTVLLKKIKTQRTHIQKRTNFVNCLKECQNRIQTYLLAA